MYKSLLISLLLISNVTWASVNDATATYEAEGKKLLALINGGKVTEAEAKPIVDKMEKSAITLMDEYTKKDAKAKDLVAFLKTNLPKMKSATFEQLEKDWHDAGALTADKVKIDLKDEANEKYLDPCHVLIHPIMTLRAIKDGKLGDAKEELTEGLEQVAAVKKQLGG